jgi:hypothetical protein
VEGRRGDLPYESGTGFLALCTIVDSDKIHEPPLRRSLVALNGRSLRFKGRSAPCEIIADPCIDVGRSWIRWKDANCSAISL